jgi:hypothetical protein
MGSSLITFASWVSYPFKVLRVMMYKGRVIKLGQNEVKVAFGNDRNIGKKLA